MKTTIERIITVRTIRVMLRRFIWEHFNEKLQYHAYKAGDAAGFAGYYTLGRFTIAFDAQDELTRQPFFTW